MHSSVTIDRAVLTRRSDGLVSVFRNSRVGCDASSCLFEKICTDFSLCAAVLSK